MTGRWGVVSKADGRLVRRVPAGTRVNPATHDLVPPEIADGMDWEAAPVASRPIRRQQDVAAWAMKARIEEAKLFGAFTSAIYGLPLGHRNYWTMAPRWTRKFVLLVGKRAGVPARRLVDLMRGAEHLESGM